MRRPLILLALVFSVCLALIIGLADTSHLGFLHRPYDFPNGDKAGHFVLYFLLTLLVTKAAVQRRPERCRRRLPAVATGAIALVVTVEELSQAWLPARSPSGLDLVASYGGIVTGLCGAHCIPRTTTRFAPPRQMTEAETAGQAPSQPPTE